MIFPPVPNRSGRRKNEDGFPMIRVDLQKLKGRDPSEVISERLDDFDLRRRLKDAKTVFIKPNLVTDVPEYIAHGANTDIRLIEAVLRYLGNYPVKIFLGESDTGPRLKGRKLRCALEEMGVYRLQKKYDFQIVNLTEDVPVTVPIKDGFFFKNLTLGKTLAEADMIINLPKIKTHKYATVTCAMKNMFGVIPDPLRVRYHPHLHKVIADLAAVFYRKMFIIVDGLVGMEGNGPLYGRPVPLDLLLFSDDPLAVDTVVARVVGFEPEEIGYLRYFRKRRSDFREEAVRITGNAVVEEVTRKFVPSRLNPVLRMESFLLPQPWFLKFIYSDFGLRYVLFPLRNVLKKFRGGGSSWYFDDR